MQVNVIMKRQCERTDHLRCVLNLACDPSDCHATLRCAWGHHFLCNRHARGTCKQAEVKATGESEVKATRTKTPTTNLLLLKRPQTFKMKLNSPGVYVEIVQFDWCKEVFTINFDYQCHVIVIADWVRSGSKMRHPG